MMPFSEADRIVFDLDDTLYPERDFVASGFAAVDAWVAQRREVAGFGATCQALFDSGVRGFVFDRALAAHPELASLTPADLVAVYRDHPPAITLCPDAARYLRAMPQPAALITDGPERTQRNKIAALGLAQHCDQIIVTGAWEPGQGKPHPRSFCAVEAAAPGRRWVYVADNPAKDFVTPRARGWATVQITRAGRIHTAPPPAPDHAADVVICDFDQLGAALAGI